MSSPEKYAQFITLQKKLDVGLLRTTTTISEPQFLEEGPKGDKWGFAAALPGAVAGGFAGATAGFALGGNPLFATIGGLGGAAIGGVGGMLAGSHLGDKQDKKDEHEAKIAEKQKRFSKKDELETKRMGTLHAMEPLWKKHGVNIQRGKGNKIYIEGGPIPHGHHIQFADHHGDEDRDIDPKFEWAHIGAHEKTVDATGRKKTIISTHHYYQHHDLHKSIGKLDSYLDTLKQAHEDEDLNESVNRYANYLRLQSNVDTGLLRKK